MGEDQKTLVTLLLDRSGSMQSVKDDTVGAINAYLQTLRDSGADIRVTLVQFDSEGGRMALDKTYVARRVADVPDLGSADYHPRGMTPLIDAACATIRAVDASLEDPRAEGTRAVVAIQTDGHENASVENDWAGLRSLVAEREARGWQFVFMGCGIDAYDQGARMGLSGDRTLAYGRGREETVAAFAASAEAVAEYASSRATRVVFSEEQKRAAGDRWDRMVR